MFTESALQILLISILFISFSVLILLFSIAIAISHIDKNFKDFLDRVKSGQDSISS